MEHIYNLAGTWNFAFGQTDNSSESFYSAPWHDTIELPGTTATNKKGIQNTKREIGHLTELYPFYGNAWYQKTITIDSMDVGSPMFLYIERTRITKLWVNGVFVSSQESLCTPHIYDITTYVNSPDVDILILVNNTNYKTKGGHLTSPDTQTNWNGLIGKLELKVKSKTYVKEIITYPCIDSNSVTIKSTIVHTGVDTITTHLCYYADFVSLEYVQALALAPKYDTVTLTPGENMISYTYKITENLKYWSEYTPCYYKLYIHVNTNNVQDTLDSEKDAHTIFGLRKFHADNHHFYINNEKTFLRGKNEALNFPLTGASPTTVNEWIQILQTAKNYGINHYRFHTCCPPDAAFTAADLMGIYMEPEIPFWGTITVQGEDGHKEEESQFLVKEGERILETYGNHPSFVMMSLGNELWGNKEKLAEILRYYKALDSRHLYTQGSNNFQWVPTILEEDDFFVGVRFSVERQIRGSYATCDIPLGFVQTEHPNTMYDYDCRIQPNTQINHSIQGEIDIQYETGIKRVKAEDTIELIPNKPVISHEIGQYTTFPNFKEIDKYTGVLRARNFEVFKERLEKAGMLHLADQFFYCSGKLAVQCYKLELEAAHRSKYLAGYQILDLQDFSGQGTALVGILDAFMDSKGLITPKEWKYFCSDAVLLAKFNTFNYTSNEEFCFELLLTDYLPLLDTPHEVNYSLTLEDNTVIHSSSLQTKIIRGVNSLGTINITLPHTNEPRKMFLKLNTLLHTTSQNISEVMNEYELMLYPQNNNIADMEMLQVFTQMQKIASIHSNTNTLYLVHRLEDAKALLLDNQRVLLIPEDMENSIEGFYCTDFWCYPMFCSISEKMIKPYPVGTMGLLIQAEHPVFKDFPSECYSTPKWYEIVSASQLAILDGLSTDLQPMVEMIDNFERNHKLGLLFEANVLNGSLLICTSKLHNILSHPEARQFAKSIINYGLSDAFKPLVTVDFEVLNNIL